MTNERCGICIRILPKQNQLSNLGIFFSETNPQYESLRFGFANPDLRIRSLRIRNNSNSRISILKDSFLAIVLRICKDSLDSWKQVESFENWLDLWSRYEPNLFKSGFVIHDTNWIFLSPDLWPTNRYKSMDSRNKSMFLRISYTIPAFLLMLPICVQNVPGSVHAKTLLVPVWDLRCSERFELVTNFLSHWSQAKGRSPVWRNRCVSRCVFWMKRFPQMSQA